MNSLLRTTLLVSFIALGVGLALWVAKVAEPRVLPKVADGRLSLQDSRGIQRTSVSSESPQRETLPTTLEPSTVGRQADPLPIDVSSQSVALPTPPPTPIPVPTTAPIAEAIAQNAAPRSTTANIEALLQTMQQNDGGSGGLSVSGLLETVKMLMDDPSAGGSGKAVPGTPANESVSNGNVAAEGPSINRVADIVGEGDQHLRINIQDEDIRKVLEILSRQGDLNILALPNVQGNVSAVLNDVDLNDALTAILRSAGLVSRRDGDFIFVGTRQDFQTLDFAQDHIGRRMYRPNYVTAADIQKVITPMLTPSIGLVSVTEPSEVGIESDATSAGGNDFASAEAVLVVDVERVLQQIDQIVAELDTVPPQVHIEAMILSVNIDDSNTVGIDWEFLRQFGNVRFGLGSPGSTFPNTTFDNGGLTLAFLDNNLGSFLVALEKIGDTNVIATPRLMCLNKQSAEILIGAKLGYVSTTQTETSTSQSIEFLEIGTQLNIRPFISNDGMIRMEVHPELSTGKVRIEGGFTLPDKEVTQVTTNVLVPDGCTVIIGGLLREDLITTSTQLPFLGSLPGLGFLFRTKTEDIERRELLILLTPRIVRPPGICCEGAEGACEFHRRQTVYGDHMNPLSRRRIGQRYFRAAQVAWSKGDRQSAMRLVNRSIGVDARSAAAIDLRADICAGRHDGDHSGGVPVPYVPPPNDLVEVLPTIEEDGVSLLDGERISPWVLEQLQNPSMGTIVDPRQTTGGELGQEVPLPEPIGSP